VQIIGKLQGQAASSIEKTNRVIRVQDPACVIPF
jgi:hypothetical protein